MDRDFIDLTGPETVDLTTTDNGIDDNTKGSKKRSRCSDDDIVQIKRNSKQDQKAAASFPCAICLDPNVERFRGYQLSACPHMFCRECLHGYIQSKLQEKTVQTLVCPACTPSSATTMTSWDIRACTLEIGDETSWRTYQEIATESFLEAGIAAGDQASAGISRPRLRRCPTNHCNFTFELAGVDGEGELFCCPVCHDSYCLNCPVVGGKVGPAHDNTCHYVLKEIRQSKERQRKLEEWKKENSQADERFQELIQREQRAGKTKPCPHCRTPITKNGGCSHMYCTKCKREFNWSLDN